jgi:hypothetical protein
MSALVIYTLRPGNMSLWLPAELAKSLGVKRGALLTSEQYADSRVQDLIARRLKRKQTDEVE